MNCKNCNHTLNQTDDYCNVCGAKVIRNRLTISNLFSHFSEHFLNYDNRLLQTFIKLFTTPEVVIGNYINGTRKKYVNAISYFAIAISIAGLQLYIINKFFPGAMDLTNYSQEGTEEINKKISSITQEYQTIIMMFYIPFYALFSKIVFINHKQYNYTEHLVMFLYIQAQLSIFSFIFFIPLLIIKVPFMIVSFIYLALSLFYISFVLKRMHGLTILEMILKILVFILIFFAIIVIPIIGVGIYTGIQHAAEAAATATP